MVDVSLSYGSDMNDTLEVLEQNPDAQVVSLENKDDNCEYMYISIPDAEKMIVDLQAFIASIRQAQDEKLRSKTLEQVEKGLEEIANKYPIFASSLHAFRQAVEITKEVK